MKPRAKWLNDVLMGTKPGRHQDKRRRRLRREVDEDMKDAKHRRWLIKSIREREAEEE